MTALYTDGFYYHPDGTKPGDVARRLAAGASNPRLDDLFALAIHETKDAIRLNDKRKDRLLARLDAIEAEIAHADQEDRELSARLVHQHDAAAKYQRGDDLDEVERELLTPKCEALVREQSHIDVEAEFKRHADTISEEWEVTGKRLDDEFIYVTMKRKRLTRTSPELTVVKKIKKAIDLLFAPDFPRECRVQTWNRSGTLSPINPGAG
jgi:hypothetical protein